MTDLRTVPREQLILHATLLSRTKNQFLSKEEDLRFFGFSSDEELIEYIIHFNDPEPENDYEDYEEWLWDQENDPYYTPSCTAGDYGPGNPWDAPGMSIHDFI